MKKILSVFLILTVLLSCVSVFADETKTEISFYDVKEDSASAEAIYKLVKAGILNGYTDGTFRPNNPLTRAELCKIINLAFGYTELASDAFIDVTPDDWFYAQVAIAKKAGYIQGHDDGTFGGNDLLTREQACAIIVRVAKLFEIPMTETITDEVSEWAVPYVNTVIANQLMPLEEGGKFRATQNITREELVMVTANFVIVPDDKPVEEVKPQYTVKVNDTKGTVEKATVEIKDGKVYITLPDTHTLSLNNQITVTVLDKDGKAVANIPVSIKDKTAEKSGVTNKSGKITLPVKESVGGGGGGGGGSTGGNTGSNTGGNTGSNTGGNTGSNTGGNTGDNTGGNTGDNTGGNNTPEPPVVTTYTVTFETDGGTEVEEQVIAVNGTVSEPTTTKDGYIFEGWYPNDKFETRYDFSRTVQKNFTLYANWVSEAENDEAKTELASIIEDLREYTFFNDNEQPLIDLALGVMEDAVADAENGVAICGNYFTYTYPDEKVAMMDAFYQLGGEGATEAQQQQAQATLYTKIKEAVSERGVDTQGKLDRICLLLVDKTASEIAGILGVEI